MCLILNFFEINLFPHPYPPPAHLTYAIYIWIDMTVNKSYNLGVYYPLKYRKKIKQPKTIC